MPFLIVKSMIDGANIVPTVTWGISPEDASGC